MRAVRAVDLWAPILLILIGLSGLIVPSRDAEAATAPVTAAGRTPGSFDVSPDGTAQYTIPIWVQRGPHGMQPAISLLYDSSQGIGPEGIGWSISGLGQITRCAKTVAQDGAASAVALQTSDGYCINGARLRLTSTADTYGLAGSTYETEVFDRTQTTAYGTQGNGPAYFIVQGSDGTQYYYGYVDSNGNGANSQVIASGSSPQTVLTWMLSKVVDTAGNSYVVNYIYDRKRRVAGYGSSSEYPMDSRQRGRIDLQLRDDLQLRRQRAAELHHQVRGRNPCL